MLYYPGIYRPSPAFLAARHLRFWPADDADYRGFISTIPIDHAKVTIIVFHGNAGTAADRDYYVQALAPLGYRVILAEYPGYGDRPGKPGEATFVNADVSTPRGIRSLFEEAERIYGGVDIVHNNAGIMTGGNPNWPDASLERISAVLAVNCGGVMMGTEAAVHAMRKRGGGRRRPGFRRSERSNSWTRW